MKSGPFDCEIFQDADSNKNIYVHHSAWLRIHFPIGAETNWGLLMTFEAVVNGTTYCAYQNLFLSTTGILIKSFTGTRLYYFIYLHREIAT